MSWRNCYLAEKCIAMTNSGKKEALQWGIRNWKMLLDIAKMHLRLRALRLPHRSHSLLKAYKHFDIIIPHQIKVWQATDQAMVFCMILHRISIISIFLYSGTKPSFPQLLHPHTHILWTSPLQATLQSITATSADIRAGNVRHAPHVRPQFHWPCHLRHWPMLTALVKA